jgi:predicted phage terminase large subunit-like protein
MQAPNQQEAMARMAMGEQPVMRSEGTEEDGENLTSQTIPLSLSNLNLIKDLVPEPKGYDAYLKQYQETYEAPIYAYIGGTEKGIVDFMVKEHNLNIITRPARNDKFVRAQPVASAWNDGRILIPKNKNWTNIFLQEIMSFTGVSDLHDDQVDVLATLYDCLQTTKKPLWRVT